MTDESDLSQALRGAHAYIQTLPSEERRVAALAADGAPAWDIAQQTQMSEQAVYRILDGVIAAVTGRERTQVETGGFGSDTDPGVTGGYGDTGFGALDTDPIPDNTEPPDPDER